MKIVKINEVNGLWVWTKSSVVASTFDSESVCDRENSIWTGRVKKGWIQGEMLEIVFLEIVLVEKMNYVDGCLKI